MLRWEEIRPYNAVHVIEFEGLHLNASRLESSIKKVLQSAGVAEVTFDRARRSAKFQSEGQIPDVVEIDLDDTSRSVLSQLMTQQLSETFSNQENCPFRFILANPKLGTAASNKQYLIVGYRHVVADAHSIVLLLKAILDHYRHDISPHPVLNANAAELRKVFVKDTGWQTAVPRTSKLAAELLQGIQIARPIASDRSSTVEISKIHPPQIEATELKLAAKKYGASVQDFLMAAEAEAIAEVFGSSCHRSLKENQRLAVTSIIDLRRYAKGAYEHSIGQFLGMLAVRPKAKMASEFSSLIQFVKTRNDHEKKKRSFFWAINSMSLMARIWDRLPLSINRDLARKLHPLACALSNVKLGAPIKQEINDGLITNYFRGANLGVLVPLVLSNTTVGNKVSFCTTHKDAVYSTAEVDQFIDCISRRIQNS